MTEEAAFIFYRSKVAEIAQSLPIGEARAFLRGALIASEAHQGMESILLAYHQIKSCDDQLQLIADEQTRLPL